MLRLAVFFMFFFLCAVVPTSDAQGLQIRANEIRAAMEARDFDRAELFVREVRAANSPAFTANNYDYLLGRLAERKGAKAEAIALYNAVLNRQSILAPYALWHLATVARASGDLALERQYLARVAATYPASVPAHKAQDRLIDSLRDSKDYRATIALLKPLASPNGVRGRKALAQLGEAYARSGDSATARAYFEQLVGGSRDDYALAAAMSLDEIDRTARSTPNEFDALRRARIYLTNRHWAEARQHLLNLVNNFPNSQNRAEALYQIGFTFYREDHYDDAIKWFERVAQEFPDKKEGSEGFYFVATALQKAQRYDDAARRYIEFLSRYPASDRVEGAYRNIPDSFRYAGKDEEAIEWSRRLGQTYAGKGLAGVALFNEARIEMARHRWEAALTLLTRLQAQPATPKLAGGYIHGEANFLRVLAIEQLGRLGEAARLYLAIADERDNYFGQRATARLKLLGDTKDGRRIIEALFQSYREQAKTALAGGRYGEAKDAANQALRLTTDENAQRNLFTILRASYSKLPAYAAVWKYGLIPAARSVATSSVRVDASNRTLAAELIFLGLYDEGATELRLGGFGGAGVASNSSDANAPLHTAKALTTFTAPQSGGSVAYSLAVYSNRGDQANHAIDFAEPLFRSVPQDYRLELLPRDLIEMLYPAPYRDALNEYSAKLGVDPRLVLSLARQESRFNPAVKSGAAARGLLQFIAETAEKLAKEEQLKNFALDDVYEPEVAVRLAVRYVADLLKLFPNNPQAIAAAYNSGEQGVERWIFRAHSSDVDCLVAEVALPETKDYVAKVMSNYRAYQLLFTPDLKPKR
ncbi:MAG: transglycosylase SLT domain-containing protein [Acidobacteria bacterium]|nr:transglycosylase SLT domain-containing protein [Acidobacteriota bacterium]